MILQKLDYSEDISYFIDILSNSCRKQFLDADGKVNWDKVQSRWKELQKIKISVGNKYFTNQTKAKAILLPQLDQQRLLNIMMGGLLTVILQLAFMLQEQNIIINFVFILHQQFVSTIESKAKLNNNIIGKYLLSNIQPNFNNISMRARVARNIKNWNLTSSMSKNERIKFQLTIQKIFDRFGIPGKYESLTPGHKSFISDKKADQLRANHYLFIDMKTDNHLTSSGIASNWPFGRGIWLSNDKSKIVWVGEQDHLRIISIIHGNDLGLVDASLYQLLKLIENSGIEFAQHQTYGFITTCPTNMGTGKRQSILGKFPNISQKGKNIKRLKQQAIKYGLQARGVVGQHSAIDQQGKSDISPLVRFGVTEAYVTQKLYEGLVNLYKAQKSMNHKNRQQFKIYKTQKNLQ